MALMKIEGGWYDAKAHGYYDEDGKFVPSVTQIISLIGLSDYSMVPRDVLEKKRRIGTEVHDLCATIDKFGDIDPSWVSEDCAPYVAAYQDFRHHRNFVPDPTKVEVPAIGCVHGMKFGCTPDAFGKLDGVDATLERKCVAAPVASWAIQTAFQEFCRYGSRSCGRSQRFALQLKANGRYKIDPHTNHQVDATRAIAALTIVYARIESGEKVWEKI